MNIMTGRKLAQCKHCGEQIATTNETGWYHPSSLGRDGGLGRCQKNTYKYGYNAEPIGSPCETPCMGTIFPDGRERKPEMNEDKRIGSRFPKTCEEIVRAGIEPQLISVDNLTVIGYDEYVLDENGKRQVHPTSDEVGEVVTTRKAWPSVAVGLAVLDVFIQEGGTRR